MIAEYFEGFREFGHNLSLIVNSILLSIAYIIGVGLTWIIARIAGKRFLDTRLEGDSYWSDLDLSVKEMDEYYRQF